MSGWEWVLAAVIVLAIVLGSTMGPSLVRYVKIRRM